MLCGSSGAPHGAVREHFESVAEGLATFQSERIDDLPSQLRQRHPQSFDASLVPPVFLEHVPKLTSVVTRVRTDGGSTAGRVADHLTHHLRTWLDEPVPALSNHSPRSAVADPSLRPKVVELMKQQVRSFDTRARETGLVVDLNDILQELGLDEIILPPPKVPPPSSGLRFGGGHKDDDDDEWMQALLDADRSGHFEPEDWDYDPSVIEMPVESRDLSMAEVVGRLSESIQSRKRGSRDAMANLLRQWPEIAHLIEKLENRINAQELSHLHTQLLMIATVLFPTRPAGLQFYPGRLWHYFSEELDRIGKSILNSLEADPEAVFIADCPQEALLRMFVGPTISAAVADSADPKNKHAELRRFAAVEIVAFMRAFLRELSHWPVE